MAEIEVVKRAWIRNNIPVGHLASGHINCSCGQAPESDFTPTQEDILCACGTLYRWDGYVLHTPEEA